MSKFFLLDGRSVPFEEGQSVLAAARRAGHYVPHLCWREDFPPHGSCKLCVVKINGRYVSSCATQAREGLVVESRIEEIIDWRRELVTMLFSEGNHFCPSCEKSGNCDLQALAYDLEILAPRHNRFFPDRRVDASHPDILLDLNRCIFCALCVRASRDVDGKNVFSFSARGLHQRLVVNAESGRLGDTDFSLTDLAAHVCPVGVILPKRKGFAVPIGERLYDKEPISAHDLAAAEKEEERDEREA
jgi:[NiFe] hydrogenase diaphorase moiety small subunit